ncbi:MAG: hypothetical protein A2Y79_01440 [Deltaproteobacteria bacterium RBG_13_43_22]|nr:MAG: hypothetical protein A2Y79_01440 [Deltaproteobacteria bacterium RBG_13_43_22]
MNTWQPLGEVEPLRALKDAIPPPFPQKLFLNLQSILWRAVGFTSGTGADWGNHDIFSWEYRDNYNPIQTPEPTTMLLFGLGLLGLVGVRRKLK